MTAAPAPREAGDQVYAQLQRLLDLGCHLVALRPGTKKAAESGWKSRPRMGIEEARSYVDRGYGLGVHLGPSRLAVLDSENEAATKLLMAAGFAPTVLPAKAQLTPDDPQFAAYAGKRGGVHFWLRVPEGVELRKDAGQIKLPGGGLVDFLAGDGSYAVAPLTRIAESPYPYAAVQGALADAAVPLTEPAVLPVWLYTPGAAVQGAGLEALAGVGAPKQVVERTWESAEAQAESQKLSDEIDRIGWDEWGVEDDPRMLYLGETDGCGCVVYRWSTADNPKSVTLHNSCEKGNGAHVWSGTMRAELGLEAEHLSRLDLSAAIRGVTRAEAARAVGLPLGQRFDYDAGAVTPLDLEADAAAAEARGDELGARRFRAAAEGLQAAIDAQRERMLATGRYVEVPTGPQLRADGQLTGMFTGAPGASLPVVDAAGNPVASGGQLAVLPGLPAVDPQLGAYAARAAQELGAEPPIEVGNAYARELLPADTRPLRETVRGPRASAAPADIEASHGLVAEAVAAAVGGSKLRYTADMEQWYGWDGGRWEMDRAAPKVAVGGLLNRRRQSGDPAVLQRKLRLWTWKKLTADERVQLAEQLKPQGYQLDAYGDLVGPNGERVFQVARECPRDAESTPFQNAVIAQLGAENEVATRTGDFDVDPAVLGTPTGYIRLGDEVTVTTPDPALLVTKLMGAAYDRDAKAPMWEAAIEAALPDAEVRGFLQRSVGQAAFGRQEEHILLSLRGLGGNGKGFALDVLEAAFGDYGVKLQASVLMLAAVGNHATDIMPLRGARWAVVNEVPAAQLNIDRVKEWTGGGTLSARSTGKDPVTWAQSHTLAVSTNNGLQWPASALRAMERRLHEIRFEQAFGDEGGPAVIAGLADRIIAEELSGVLNWILAGWADYVARGRQLDPPAKVVAWSRETIAASSSWASFCAMAFEVTKSKTDEIPAQAIWKVWDHYRDAETDQKHATPGSVRALPAAVCEQLRGVTAIPSKGKKRAALAGLKWSPAAEEMIHEHRLAGFPAAGFPSPAFAPTAGPTAAPTAIPTMPPRGAA